MKYTSNLATSFAVREGAVSSWVEDYLDLAIEGRGPIRY